MHVQGILAELAPLLVAVASLVVALRTGTRAGRSERRLDVQEGLNEPQGWDVPPRAEDEAGY